MIVKRLPAIQGFGSIDILCSGKTGDDVRDGRSGRAARCGGQAGVAAVHERLSAEGLRVLAIAYRWMEPRPAYSRDEEADLVLAGLSASWILSCPMPLRYWRS